MDKLTELRQLLATKIEEARGMLTRWEAEGRDPTEDETKLYDVLLTDSEKLKDQIGREERQSQLDVVARKITHPAPHEPLEDPGVLGLDPREIRRYSLFNALRATHEKDWRSAGFERECSMEIEKRAGKQAQGFFVPYDVLLAPQSIGRAILENRLAKRWGMTQAEFRVLQKSTSGANLVASELDAAGFIDVLRNRSSVVAAGARLLTDLVGDQDIPRKTAANAASWLLDETTDVAATDITLDQVTLTPKTVAIRSDISRRMLKQGTPSAEQIIRDDIGDGIAVAIDDAAFNGTGAGGQPTGLYTIAGVGDVEMGSPNGGLPTWVKVLEFEEDIAIPNSLLGSVRYIVNATTRSQLKQVLKVAADAGAGFLWELGAFGVTPDGLGMGMGPGDGIVNGYLAHVTNSQLSNVTKGTGGNLSKMAFGNWNDLLIGMWGVLDLFVDPFTLGDRGAIVVRGFQDIDIQFRRVSSFSKSEDVITPIST